MVLCGIGAKPWYINSQKFRQLKFRRKNFGGKNFGEILRISAEKYSVSTAVKDGGRLCSSVNLFAKISQHGKEVCTQIIIANCTEPFSEVERKNYSQSKDEWR